jgi:TIR domain
MARFVVGISFAGAQRDYAEALKNSLQAKGVAVFYDNDFRHELWGENLAHKFFDIFGADIDSAIVLVSKDYVERVWPRYEASILIDRQLKSQGAFILPIRFDDSVLKGLVDTTHYERAETLSPEGAALLFCRKQNIDLSKLKASAVPPPQMTALLGEIGFDYGSYNGRYILGNGDRSFDTYWSGSGGDSIMAHDRGVNIIGIAIATGANSLADIKDADAYDDSSAYRRPKVGEWLLVKNDRGYCCAIKIEEVRSRSHGSTDDYLKIRYVITEKPSGDFSAYSAVS